WEEGEEVRRGSGREARARMEVQVPVRARGVVLLRRDVTVDEHRMQNLVAARERLVGTYERVVDRRRLRQAGEERRLVERERTSFLGEVRLRGGLDPILVVA